jgi:glycosyltransferase involved in cell wall biosynthesis
MNASPLVSIVVATYNQDAFLSEAIDSLLKQDFRADGFEVIIVDDGSNDRTPEILRRYSGDVIAITQTHQGLVPACNAGLASARGRFFARVDSDDFVASSWLRRTVEALENAPEACCVHPDYLQVEESGATQPLSRRDEGGLFNLVACGVLFRTDSVRAVGGFRPMYWEEYDLYMRLSEAGRFLHLPEPLYFYRKHSSSMTASVSRRLDGWRELINVWGIPRLRAAGSCAELEQALEELEAGH